MERNDMRYLCIGGPLDGDFIVVPPNIDCVEAPIPDSLSVMPVSEDDRAPLAARCLYRRMTWVVDGHWLSIMVEDEKTGLDVWHALIQAYSRRTDR